MEEVPLCDEDEAKILSGNAKRNKGAPDWKNCRSW